MKQLQLLDKAKRELSEAIPRLTLLGVTHHDPDGFINLGRFLTNYQPDVILLEISPYAVALRKRRQVELQGAFRRNLEIASYNCGIALKDALKRPEITALRRQISLPFEFRAASAHTEKSGAALVFVDQSSFSWRLTALWQETTSVENLTLLLSTSSMAPHARQIYMKARRSIDRGVELRVQEFKGELDATERLWARREYFMAKQIKGALLLHGPRKPLYIGGWQHLTLDARLPTLRGILGIARRQCMLLDYAESQ
jgi:hypothetical protein